MIATWDDHDYGHNDIGEEYGPKEESKQVFLNFFGEENNMERQSHPGIYTSYYYGDSAHLAQIILLDLRTFRSKLKEGDGDYVPNYDSAATILGNGQWNWLHDELLQPAVIRIIGSSSRFATTADGDECWANFPYEHQRMFQLIRDTHASGVLFISGDVHFGCLAKRQEQHLYPIYDFTASPLARHANGAWDNPYTIVNAPRGYNFGMIEIDWRQSDPEITLVSYNEAGSENFSRHIHLSEIYF